MKKCSFCGKLLDGIMDCEVYIWTCDLCGVRWLKAIGTEGGWMDTREVDSDGIMDWVDVPDGLLVVRS